MRTLALLSVFLALPGLGCVAKIGASGLIVGVGQVEVCSEGYGYDDTTGRYKCPGEYVAGAALSETGSRALGAVGEPIMRVGAALAGVPLPGKQPVMVMPPTPPKVPGP